LTALGYARDYLRDRTQELSRYWYLSSSMGWSFLFLVLAGIVWLNRDCVQSKIRVEPFWLVLAVCFGALGALLSVMSRTGNLAFSSSSGRYLHILEALSRISLGAMSGGVLGLAILSKVFLSPADSHQMHVLMMLVAFAAGASERLAPSIIAEFEKRAPALQKDDKTSKNDVHERPPGGYAPLPPNPQDVKPATVVPPPKGEGGEGSDPAGGKATGE
jgi:hypothetical protein